MPSPSQSRLLRAAAVLSLLLFAVQPKLTERGFPIGWRLFWVNYDTGGVWTGLYPDYRMIAVEFAILAFATTCLYLAAGQKQS